MNQPVPFPCCLTVAGSDCGGNAGIQADLRAFHAYGLHGCTVFAALTAQNPFCVSAIHNVPADFVAAQLDAILGVYNITAMKTGMLSEASVIEVLAERLERHSEITKVIDPVIVATSGIRLVPDATVKAIRKQLLPLAQLVTPNLPEAEVLCDRPVTDPNAERLANADHAAQLAREIHARYGCAVLVKGGHGNNTDAVDVLFDGREERRFPMPWIANPVSTHGTGCSLAAALTAEFARGASIVEAVTGAKAYVHRAIANAFIVGKDCGVLGFSPMK